MFREMRRIKQQLSVEEAVEIIKSHNTCTLALAGDDGYPYSLPISYAFIDGKIYFHCAKVGHKIDAIKSNEKVSLSIIHSDEIIEERFTNKYKSVIVFGKAKIIDGQSESLHKCAQMTRILCPDMSDDDINEEIEHFSNQTAVVEITPEHITGKEGLEFYNLRNK